MLVLIGTPLGPTTIKLRIFKSKFQTAITFEAVLMMNQYI